ncbi:SDR family oxidoreductase [Actinomadura sp. LD22]|uniref:SDR family oxidoreductase n=1 Tax=Actinomadura physcomitrii TaxID=2650748 RepID=A0A6I4M6V0_9ACTN|nr:SDR family oxidoreductase [Actinomadura physcomitrii]MVZ99886.1 SDR family oxidoreductase [Actinomadura physcomitrii]
MAGANVSFAGGTVLVTGASRNIGKAIACTLAAHGLAIGINARSDREGAEKTCAEIVGAGGRAVVAMGDVGDPEACGRIVDTVTSELGPIGYLISNASVRHFQAFTDISIAEWDGALRSNLSALFYLSRLVLPGMKERGFGRVIALGGPDGYLGWHHRAHNVTAKAGLTGLVKAISFEFGHFGVTANIVVPGGTETTRDAADYPADMTTREGVPEGRPLVMIPRLGSTTEIADACAFLCSDSAGYITGQSLHVDGGMVMR